MGTPLYFLFFGYMRHTRHSQHTAHSQHAAHISQQHSSTYSSTAHRSTAVAAGSSCRTGHRALCAARLRGINHVGCRRQCWLLRLLRCCRTATVALLPTIMLLRLHNPPLSNVGFLMAHGVMYAASCVFTILQKGFYCGN